MARSCEQSLGDEHGLQPTVSKKLGPQAYSNKELNSANGE